MIGLILGIFLLIMCFVMIMFGSGDLFGFVGVGLVGCLAVWLIITQLKKMKNDRVTERNGEVCFGKILDCVETGAFAFSKREYKVIVSLYVASLQRRLILEEIVGFNNQDKYPKNSYFKIIYYNGDINVKMMVYEHEIPQDILNKLNDEAVNKEYSDYQKEQEIKREEQRQKEYEMAAKAERVVKKVEKAYTIYTIIGFYIFSIILIFVTSYFSKMIKMFKDFSTNMPMVIIYPIVLIINLSVIYPMIKNPVNSKKRVIFGLLWFFTMAFIMIQGGFN